MEELATEGFDDVDRISFLPEVVIYHLMSFLPTKEVVRTSILSKRWECIQASYPNLDFNQIYFGNILAFRDAKRVPDLERKRDKFIRFVDDTLVRFREKNLRIRKLKIFFTIFDSTMVSLVDRWIGLATESMVEELDLEIRPARVKCYTLPEIVFAAKSLKALKLYEIKLELPLHGRIRFHSMQKLCLMFVHVDTHLISGIISHCPLIEEISLQHCLGLHRVHISGLHNLKKVEIVQGDEEIETCIEASSLQKFSVTDENYGMLPCKFNLIGCQNLTLLDLTGVINISDQLFNDLLSEFPLLEILYVYRCDSLERVKISNQHLNALVFAYCNTLVEVELDAPNLGSFLYEGSMVPLIASASVFGRWEVYIEVNSNDCMNYHWFHSMRDLLTKSKNFKVLTLLITAPENSFNVEELRDISLPSAPALEHVELIVQSSSLSYSALIDGLLWSCRPKTLSLAGTNFERRINFIKVLCEKTLHRFDVNCRHFGSIQCWQHGLKDIEIYDGERRVFHWNSSSDTIPTLQQRQKTKITFKW